MLLDLETARKAEALPAEWRTYVEPAGDGFVVRGDRTAKTDLFLTLQAGVVVSDRIEDVLGRMRARGVGTQPSPFAMTALLQSGLVPPPYSEFDGIYTLTTGDVAHVTWHGGHPRVELEVDYPWFPERSRNDSVPSERTLLDLLTKATQRNLEDAGGSGFLMMSSGKDSAAVALALAEAGRSDIPCVTFGAGPGDPEPEIAARICRRLGFDHTVVETPSDPRTVARLLTRFFELSPRPGTDLKQIPYVLATAGIRSDGGAVLDGGGNDAYMGFPVTGKWARKTQLRLRSRRLIDFVQRHVTVDSPINYVARSRMETILSGRLLRFHEIEKFMPAAVDPRGFWTTLSQADGPPRHVRHLCACRALRDTARFAEEACSGC